MGGMALSTRVWSKVHRLTFLCITINLKFEWYSILLLLITLLNATFGSHTACFASNAKRHCPPPISIQNQRYQLLIKSWKIKLILTLEYNEASIFPSAIQHFNISFFPFESLLCLYTIKLLHSTSVNRQLLHRLYIYIF